jgi:hypothetical protein
MKTNQSHPTTPSETREMITAALHKAFERPPQRRKSSIENLKMEENRADQETNTHWSTRVTRPEAVKRRSSSLSLDMKDSILNFKDQDGNYASACDHSVLEDDHKCFCKSKSAAIRK